MHQCDEDKFDEDLDSSENELLEKELEDGYSDTNEQPLSKRQRKQRSKNDKEGQAQLRQDERTSEESQVGQYISSSNNKAINDTSTTSEALPAE